MNDEHSHPHHEHEHPGESPMDAGSQALSEALRSSFAIVRFVMFLLVLVFLASGFFTVKPNERAIILRFGKPRGEGEKALLGPGWPRAGTCMHQGLSHWMSEVWQQG